MDDFSVSSLHESKNEWCARLITIMTPLVIDGCNSILEESLRLCKDNNENDKYLMTFQNLISRIPKWNNAIIETERKRMAEKSKCVYLEDLITCVHIIQLKLLTVARVGIKQKKIDLAIPKLDDFIHKIYINVARKIYKNVYLFQRGIPPLQIQKNNRELEIIVQECILNTIRESIPVEKILEAYLGEEETIEEKTEEIIQVTPDTSMANSMDGKDNSSGTTEKVNSSLNEISVSNDFDQPLPSISFEDVDYVKESDNTIVKVDAPKTEERLNELSKIKAQERMDTDDYQKISISDQSVSLSPLDIHVIEDPNIALATDIILDDIEILD